MKISLSVRRLCFLLLLGIAVIGVDVLVKHMTVKYIPLNGATGNGSGYGVVVFRDFFGVDFSLGHVRNTGAAWGVFKQYATYLLALRIFFVCGLGFYLVFLSKDRSLDTPLTLILAGAMGNILDFFVHGSVVDMFHFVFWGYEYPLFNVADMFISIGIVWIIMLSVFTKSAGTSHGS